MFRALLLTCVMSLNFVACDKGNGNEPSPYFTADELVGTVWSGTNKAQNNYEIKIVNKTDLRLNVKSSKGTVYVDNETLKYQYNQENGNFIKAALIKPDEFKLQSELQWREDILNVFNNATH